MTSLSSVSFRNDQFLISEGLNPSNVMEYFYQSPFYLESGGAQSINELIRRGSIPASSATRVDGDIFLLVEMNAEAKLSPPPVDGAIYVIQKLRQSLNRPKTAGHVFYVISGTIYLAPGLGMILERHLAKSIAEFDEMIDAVGHAVHSHETSRNSGN